MKLDFNNIDEVFKDGLEDFTEQPSGNVWQNISGKMFWYDLLHLRFGNIPKAWLGAVAGVLIMAVLIGIWAIPGSDETVEEGQPVAETVEKTQQIDQPDNKIDQQVNAVFDLEIINQGAQTVDQQIDFEEFPNALKNVNRRDETPLPDDKSAQEIIVQNSTTAQTTKPVISTTTKSSNQTIEKPEIDQSVSTESNSEEMVKAAAAGFAVAATANPASTTPAATEIPNVSQNAVGTKAETIDADSRIYSENQPISAESSIDGVEKMTTENAAFESIIEINKSMGAMKKMPEPGGISFSAAQPVHYGRQPAKRNYQYPQGFFNRGYQPYFSVSAYFAPEVTEYHRMASESRENSWLAGVAVSYNTEKYIIQTGLEYSVFDDLGDYMVNINSYDSIGYYEGVSGFEIDPENPGELIYHTHTVEVWDTVQHHSHQQTRNNYAYLQIPVLFGYKAMESGIFSAHIKAGPSFSFLLNRDEPTLNFQTGPGARISSVDNFTASRLNTNVQVLVSLALRLQFAERVGLLVEPTYRYYINSVYDVNNEALKNPNGIGVRGGLFFNF